MQAMGLEAKRHRTEVGQTEPDGAQTQNFYPCAGRFPVIATVKEICPNDARLYIMSLFPVEGLL